MTIYEAQAAQLKTGITDIPLILCVGTIEPRKNHVSLIHACIQLHLRGVALRLVLVGNMGWKGDEILQAIELAKKSGLNIVWKESASDEVLHNLYQECAFTVFCSKAEGFGLPVLESIGMGKVCIASDIPCIREIATQYPEACVLVNPNSVEEIATAIEHQLKHPKTLNIKIPIKTWDEYADELYEFFKA